MRNLHHGLRAGLIAAACCLAAGPEEAPAQQAFDASDTCSLIVAPRQLPAGLVAVKTTARFSERIGPVTDVVIPGESGIELTSEERLERLFARSENGRPPSPIEFDPATARATLWLNLMHASSGQYRIVIRGDRASCTGTLLVG